MKQSTVHRGRRCNAFTLVELVMVMVIIGVVGAIALPRFSQANSRQQLQAAADRVAADIELARTRARASSRTVYFSFNAVTDNYKIHGSGGTYETVELDASPYGIDISKANFNSASSFSFNGFGVPSSSGFVSLQSGDNSVTITLEANGEVRQ